jgi:hypothetical protein
MSENENSRMHYVSLKVDDYEADDSARTPPAHSLLQPNIYQSMADTQLCIKWQGAGAESMA